MTLDCSLIANQNITEILNTAPAIGSDLKDAQSMCFYASEVDSAFGALEQAEQEIEQGDSSASGLSPALSAAVSALSVGIFAGFVIYANNRRNSNDDDEDDVENTVSPKQPAFNPQYHY